MVRFCVVSTDSWSVERGNTTHWRQPRSRLEEALRLAHGGLDVERANVLPLLLEERDEEVDRKHGVLHDLVLLHVDVADGDTEAENLLELELDGRANLVDLAGKVLGVRDGRGELAGLGETGTEETGDLLDEGLRGKESVVLGGELLDELLVLVELLKVLNSHEGELLVELLGTVNVHGVGENAELHAGTGNVGELDGTRETLVTLRLRKKSAWGQRARGCKTCVVVLQSDL